MLSLIFVQARCADLAIPLFVGPGCHVDDVPGALTESEVGER